MISPPYQADEKACRGGGPRHLLLAQDFSSAKYGLRVRQAPRVKSGNGTGALPFEMEISDSPTGALITTES